VDEVAFVIIVVTWTRFPPVKCKLLLVNEVSHIQDSSKEIESEKSSPVLALLVGLVVKFVLASEASRQDRLVFAWMVMLWRQFEPFSALETNDNSARKAH
jgi:hypothetical protein